jgi:hypothetical protein
MDAFLPALLDPPRLSHPTQALNRIKGVASTPCLLMSTKADIYRPSMSAFVGLTSHNTASAPFVLSASVAKKEIETVIANLNRPHRPANE